jgi:acyl-CoA thioester hydrolase
MTSEFDAPIVAPAESVRPEWIDHNGHLNMAYYNVLFDHGVDHMFELLGCGPDYVKTRNFSIFTAEVHLRYLRELKVGERVRATVQLLAHDERKLHIFQELHHEEGWVAASSEGLLLHVDLGGPRVVPFPADIAERLQSLQHCHDTLARPADAGRSMALGRSRATDATA